MHLPLTAICSITTAIFIGCTVKTPLVEPLAPHPSKSGDYADWNGAGVVYALPKTAFDLQLTMSRTEFDDPKCAADDKGLKQLDLDRSDIQSKGAILFAFHASSLTARAVPDPKRVFVSRFPSSSGWADSALVVKMGPAGTIEGAEGSGASKAVSVTAKVLELVGKVGAAAVLLGSSKATEDPTECAQRINEYVTLGRALKAYRDKPTPFSKETLDLYQKEIKAEQAMIQALFMGKPTVTESTAVCSLAPDAKGTAGFLDFYPKAGVTPAAGVECQMEPKFLAPSRVAPGNAVKKATIALDIVEVDRTLLDANAAGKEAPSEAGFFYVVPVRALVSLGGHPKVMAPPTSYLLPQLGDVRALPRAQGSSPALVVELHPDTGALKSVKVSNSAADFAGLVGSVTTGTSDVLTALTTRRDKAREAAQEEAAKQDPLAILTREQAMLEAELAIATAKEALRQLAAP